MMACDSAGQPNPRTMRGEVPNVSMNLTSPFPKQQDFLKLNIELDEN